MYLTQSTLPRLNIIGAGRVGQTLARLWHTHHVFAVQDLICRTVASSQVAQYRIGAGVMVESLYAMRPAEVWMLAVPDAQIASVAATLASAHIASEQIASPIIFHCSGAQNASLLEPLTDLGWHCASAHCILSFANVETALQQFSGTACALEGDTKACTLLEAAFGAIGAQCFAVASHHKILYHAAAVFATNFLPVLQFVAEQAWQATGVPEHLLPHLRQSLLQNAVYNIIQSGPRNALTGPAARGDLIAIERQANSVQQWNPLVADAYRALSALALEMKKETTNPPQ
jgi:predicted short-subunit dehydrogenase-like oxidoreductase (DUF2520 family)